MGGSVSARGFRVRKAILSEASPVFESMFSLPSSAQISEDLRNKPRADSRLPSVPVTEDGHTLEALLRLCYPVDEKSVNPNFTLDGLISALVAAQKYDIDRTERYITQLLRQAIAESPLRVYCLSVRFQLGQDFTRAAA